MLKYSLEEGFELLKSHVITNSRGMDVSLIFFSAKKFIKKTRKAKVEQAYCQVLLLAKLGGKCRNKGIFNN